MRVTLRLLGGIWLALVVTGGAFAYLQVSRERGELAADLERRAWLLGEGLKEAVEPLLGRAPVERLDRILRRFDQRSHGIAIYDRFASLVTATPEIRPTLPPDLPFVSAAVARGEAQRGFQQLAGRPLYQYTVPLLDGDRTNGALVILLDAETLERHTAELVRQNALRFVVLGLALSLIVVVVVRWTVTRPVRRLAQWAHQARSGQAQPPPPGLPDPGLFGPLATEVGGLARSLARARAEMEREARLRLEGQSTWTEERLKQVATSRLGGHALVVVSNREPVSHVWEGRRIRLQFPASGVVTAMEPIMRACGGVWVAHGSGDADREVVDQRGTLRVPPDDPRYTLRRVWLSPEEEDGYYYGLANEGLWPLCHIVHARPTFRPEDWAHYVAVNRKFADAVLDEVAGVAGPVVLIQDYHFALLPRLLRTGRPDARIALFWHIPWPNPEAFGICPWQTEILHGMLGADLVGFHTQFHCNNFLETVDRAIEARLDWAHFTVTRGQHVTRVQPFPISVAPRLVDDPPRESRADVLARLGLTVEFLGVGVERIDYTKGIPERLAGLRRFFIQQPEYRGRLTFVQLAAPSRSRIPRYRALEDEVEALVAAINGELETASWRPILLLKGHHDHREIWPYYRCADFCMVTSLHDGMNLVAKEYVAAREDGDGVLILSRFTGAARELPDAVLVNPYDVEEMAGAIRTAVAMAEAERRARMGRMRQAVQEHNIYRWAGTLLEELCRVPVSHQGVETAPPAA